MQRLFNLIALIFLSAGTCLASPRLDDHDAPRANDTTTRTYQLFNAAKNPQDCIRILSKLIAYTTAKRIYTPELKELQTLFIAGKQGGADHAHHIVQAITKRK